MSKDMSFRGAAETAIYDIFKQFLRSIHLGEKMRHHR
jgi:hypothetical protein